MEDDPSQLDKETGAICMRCFKMTGRPPLGLCKSCMKKRIESGERGNPIHDYLSGVSDFGMW